MDGLIRVLGIDPGTRVVGFGLLEVRGLAVSPRDFAVVEAGVVRLDAKMPLIQRLGQLHATMHELTAGWRPHICVLESAFFGVNAQSSLKLGQARGAIIAALTRLSVPIEELTPAQVKKVIAGNGQGGKEAVALSVCQFLKFDRKNFSFDATDALALALCYGLSGMPTLRASLACSEYIR